MYILEQLNEMTEAQLHELAKSMGLKKVDSLEREALVYEILDHQAETDAANTPEPVKRRRERIRQPAAKANGTDVTKDDAVATKSKNKKEKKKVSDEAKVEAKPKNRQLLLSRLPSVSVAARRQPRKPHAMPLS